MRLLVRFAVALAVMVLPTSARAEPLLARSNEMPAALPGVHGAPKLTLGRTALAALRAGRFRTAPARL